MSSEACIPTDKLEEGLRNLFGSGEFKNYLTAMSRFYNYNFKSVLMIVIQKPDATFVADRKTWQKDFNRNVRKGEKGIKIFVPALSTKESKEPVLSPRTGEPLYDDEGNPMMESSIAAVPSYRTLTVFDISQTYGEPLPSIEVKELMGNASNYKALFNAFMEFSDVDVVFENITSGVGGYFDPVEQKIAIKNGMSEAQTLKTLVHELAHSMTHPDCCQKDRETKELEAESVAFVVCRHFGIDTSDWSLSNIADWSGASEMDILKETLALIQRTSAMIINEVTRILSISYITSMEKSIELISGSDCRRDLL